MDTTHKNTFHNKPLHIETLQQLNDCHYPQCSCPAGAVYDFKLREFVNGTLHVYRFCRTCGAVAQSPVKRTSIPFAKWRELCQQEGVRQ